MPKITLPTVKFSLPSVKVPTITIPIKKIVTVLGIINTSILITIGGLGLFVSYINPIPWITPYIQFSVANQLFEYVQYLQANSMYTIGASSGLIVFGLLLHVANFKSWWKVIKATPMAIVRSPLNAYRKTVIWRNWILAKINYLNEESAKWKTFFKVAMSPYSLLRAMGFSPQMAVGLLAVGSTAAGGVAVNETILAERSFTNGDSGI